MPTYPINHLSTHFFGFRANCNKQPCDDVYESITSICVLDRYNFIIVVDYDSDNNVYVLNVLIFEEL